MIKSFPTFTHPTDLFCRIAHHQGMVRDIFCDHGAGAYEGILANGVAADNRALAPMVAPFLTRVGRTWSILEISARGL